MYSTRFDATGDLGHGEFMLVGERGIELVHGNVE